MKARKSTTLGAAARLAGLGMALLLLTGAAAPPHPRLKIWDLPLGASVDKMPAPIEFKGYACGSNGGPPLTQLKGWADFGLCAPEASGLHEVYFEYDDEAEYTARAHEDIRIGRDVGTVDKSFPIIASALFDNARILQGIRLVTDPRYEQQPDNDFANLRSREEHYLLAPYLAGQFKLSASADCVQQPLGAHESGVGGNAIKTDCERTDAAEGRRYVMQQRYFRKAGQAARDPHTGQLTVGQFESLTRAEVYAAAAPKPAQ
ncbi:MAG: hypothetical protein JWN11_1541 [Hyphomicrobiales bacterium]|nr:hypothetical protein [Hyphomicrobiales bacterium]